MKLIRIPKYKITLIWFTITFTATLSLVSTILTGCTKNVEPISRTGFYFDTVIQITLYDTVDEAKTDRPHHPPGQ